ERRAARRAVIEQDGIATDVVSRCSRGDQLPVVTGAGGPRDPVSIVETGPLGEVGSHVQDQGGGPVIQQCRVAARSEGEWRAAEAAAAGEGRVAEQRVRAAREKSGVGERHGY